MHAYDQWSVDELPDLAAAATALTGAPGLDAAAASAARPADRVADAERWERDAGRRSARGTDRPGDRRPVWHRSAWAADGYGTGPREAGPVAVPAGRCAGPGCGRRRGQRWFWTSPSVEAVTGSLCGKSPGGMPGWCPSGGVAGALSAPSVSRETMRYRSPR